MNARRLWALSVLAGHSPARPAAPDDTGPLTMQLDVDATEVILVPLDDCRSKVNGRRCGHAEVAHRRVGHTGWRMRCAGCGCKAYRKAWTGVVLDVGLGLLIAVLVVLALAFAAVAAGLA